MLVIGEHTWWGIGMNHACTLGEDTAEAGETLLTDTTRAQVRDVVADVRYEHVTSTEAPFSCLRVLPAG